MPIRVRLALSFAVITLVLVVVGGVLFARSFRGGVESSLAPGLRSQAGALSTRCAPPDPGPSTGSALTPTDVVAQIFEPDGTVVATTPEAGPRPSSHPR